MAPHESEEREQWEPDNRKIVALDLLEELYPQALNLVCTGAPEHGSADRLLDECGLSPQRITSRVLSELRSTADASAPVALAFDDDELHAAIARVKKLALPPELADWVRQYACVGHRDGFLWNWCLEGVRLTSLSVVDPALRAPGSIYMESGFELARSLGADVAIEVGIRWRERATLRLGGGRAEVRVRARRTDDGSEVALARFAAPAYHVDPDEAFARALEAVQAQVAENLALQLNRNWRALTAQDPGPVELRLLNATSLGQVDAVQETLRNVLGAEEASLVTLAPWVAEILVKGPLSPGALLERLVGVDFDGFRLRPVEISRQGVEVRVEPLIDPEAAPRPPSVGVP